MSIFYNFQFVQPAVENIALTTIATLLAKDFLECGQQCDL